MSEMWEDAELSQDPGLQGKDAWALGSRRFCKVRAATIPEELKQVRLWPVRPIQLTAYFF